MSRGIVLDADLSAAFKLSAAREGILLNNGKQLSQFQQTLFQSPKYGPEELAAIAYSSIVLFGKIYIQSFSSSRNGLSEWYGQGDFVDYDPLVKDGIVELVRIEGNHPLISMGEIRPNDLRYKEIDFAEFSSKRAILISCAMSMAPLNSRRRIGRQRLEEAYEILYRQIYKAQYGKRIERDRRWKPNPVVEAHVEKPQLYDPMNLLVHSYHSLRHTINTSCKLDCSGRSIVPPLSMAEEARFGPSESAFRIYQIILEEDCTFPFPRTLSSAITLSRDRRILDFREVLSFWSNALLEGDLGVERSLRKEITKANRELKRLSVYKRIGRLITFASIPISIASILMEFPFGLFVLPVSPAIVVDSIRREKKHSWLLFGK